VRQYIDSRVVECVEANDADDWKFVREVVASIAYDLPSETQLMFRRLKDYRSELEVALKSLANEPGFQDVDLDILLGT
jgi:hypothetical protein